MFQPNFQTSGTSFNFAVQMQAQDRATRATRDFVPVKVTILDTTALEAKLRQWRKDRAILDEILADTKREGGPHEDAARKLFLVPAGRNPTPAQRKAEKVALYGAMYS